MPRKKKGNPEMKNNKMKEAMDEAAKDERFSKVLENPLYRRVPKKEKSVTIDKRFQSMFHDKSFKLKYHMDARGRPLQTTSNENLKRLYNLEQSDEEGSDSEKEDAEGEIEKVNLKDDVAEEESSESEEDSEQEDDEIEGHFGEPDLETKSGLTKLEKKKLRSEDIDYTRGEGRLYSEESSSDSDSSVDEEAEADVMHEWGEMDRDAPRTEESTRRLALCNMDWDRISSSDLMVLFHSFLPAGGMLKKVSIYPSEFGKQRLAEEEVRGPQELIEDKLDESDEEDGSGDDEEGRRFNMEKLRKYQLNRLKYYYAVLEFDSVETADSVYKECDGMEYESSATRVDLRFIPDDMVFDEEPKEFCDKLPVAEKYRPRFFTTKALQQFKVDLTWDETDPRRRELTNRMFNPKEKVDDEDIQAYLASSESESEAENDETGDNKDADTDQKDPILKYKALLQSIEDNENKKKDKDVEMEITWGVGLKQKSEDLVKKKLEEKAAAKMTPWEEMLAKRREKRKTRKAEKKETEKEFESGSSTDDSSDDEKDEDEIAAEEGGSDVDQPFSDDDVDVDLDDPFFKEEMKSGHPNKQKKTKSKPENTDTEQKQKDKQTKKQAELELLLMDEQDDGKHHFSMKKIMDAEKEKSKKKKKKRKGQKKEAKPKFEDDFAINLQDDRFNALFTSHKFNVDPSDPNFKKTKAMETLIQEKQKRRLDEGSSVTKSTLGGSSEDNQPTDVTPSKKSKSELAFLVKSIKGKAESLNNKKKNSINKSKF